MRILIIGSGGREHALAWKLGQEPGVERIFIAPGNGGTALLGENIPLAENDIPGLTRFAVDNAVDLVVPGPELPLTLGVSDAMREAGIACFGPGAACARLEGSKAFAKDVMRRAKVPTAAYGVFTNQDEALAFVRRQGAPLVVKADGLAAGKGVILCPTEEDARQALHDMFSARLFGAAGDSVVVEEFLEGEEVSLLCFCDGKNALPLPSAQDHKAVDDGDQGPNTGGMGAYSPAPVLPDAQLETMTDLVVRPVLRVMAEDGAPFCGILYAGLMITKDGPKVLEYNVRFGDPECQPLLMRLGGNLTELMLACVRGDLEGRRLDIRPEAALGVVLAAHGYPGAYERGMAISGLEDAEALDGVCVFQAGTRLEQGVPRSNGGRILCVAALGRNLAAAQTRAYLGMSRIRMENSHYRKDIGDKGLHRPHGNMD